MTSYAYLRKEFPVRTILQLEAILEYTCQEVYIEEGALNKSPELDSLLEKLKSNDQLIVYDLQVFVRSISQLKKLFKALLDKDVHLISIKDGLNTQKSKQFYPNALIGLSITSTAATKSTKKIESLQHKKQVLGRPKVDEDIVDKIIYLSEKKGLSMREIAGICEVSLGTVHKYVNNNIRTSTHLAN